MMIPPNPEDATARWCEFALQVELHVSFDDQEDYAAFLKDAQKRWQIGQLEYGGGSFALPLATIVSQAREEPPDVLNWLAIAAIKADEEQRSRFAQAAYHAFKAWRLLMP